MNNVVLKGYKVTKLEFVNKHDNGTKVQLGNKVSYNVKYDGTRVCIGELSVETFDKQAEDKFGVKIVLTGIFEYNPENEKEIIHVATFKELYPLCKSIIIAVSANAGIPPIIIPPFDVEGHDIYRFEKPQK